MAMTRMTVASCLACTDCLFAGTALLAAIAMVTLCAPEVALGQNLTGTINGIVVDSSGAVIPHASVNITNDETGVIARSTFTDKSGFYSAPSLLPDTYDIKVQAPGFNTTEVSAIHLNVDEAIPVNVTMRIGSVATQVSVTSTRNTPDIEDASTGTQVEGKQITEIPLSSRNFLQFLSHELGVNAGTGDNPRGNVKISGSSFTSPSSSSCSEDREQALTDKCTLIKRKINLRGNYV